MRASCSASISTARTQRKNDRAPRRGRAETIRGSRKSGCFFCRLSRGRAAGAAPPRGGGGADRKRRCGTGMRPGEGWEDAPSSAGHGAKGVQTPPPPARGGDSRFAAAAGRPRECVGDGGEAGGAPSSAGHGAKGVQTPPPPARGEGQKQGQGGESRLSPPLEEGRSDGRQKMPWVGAGSPLDGRGETWYDSFRLV